MELTPIMIYAVLYIAGDGAPEIMYYLNLNDLEQDFPDYDYFTIETFVGSKTYHKAQ